MRCSEPFLPFMSPWKFQLGIVPSFKAFMNSTMNASSSMTIWEKVSVTE